MIQFFTDLPAYSFLQAALLAGFLASLPAGVVGSLIVVRRSSYIAGAISHCVLGGMGAARYFQVVYGLEWMTPLAGAVVASLVGATIIGLATIYMKERADSVMSIVWAVGMALGISFVMKTPGYGQDLMSYLFGNILMVSGTDLLLMAILDIIILVLTLLFYNRILAICFNEEAARVRGVPVGFYTMLMFMLIALTTVLLVQVVGIVLVIALLSIPAATIAPFTRKLSFMMIGATILCFILIFAGLVISYSPELPAGATIIELAGATYLVSLFFRKWKRK
ncbi:MAG: metal ABC transporter permease [Fibrobacteria bacterium]|nr:metal ABC transporter permease [Fibrobacteria bacterium]